MSCGNDAGALVFVEKIGNSFGLYGLFQYGEKLFKLHKKRGAHIEKNVKIYYTLCNGLYMKDGVQYTKSVAGRVDRIKYKGERHEEGKQKESNRIFTCNVYGIFHNGKCFFNSCSKWQCTG